MSTFANRIERLKPSPIRDILHVIEQPGVISFAGGLPSQNSFPDMNAIEMSPQQLQYGPTEGDAALRHRVAEDLSARGLTTHPEHVLILSGSQQGIDLVAKLLVDTGTRVAVESPTYLAALQVFSLFGASYVPYTYDTPNDIAASDSPALTYVIPTFQNPTGQAYSKDQRQALADVCDYTGTVVFEDDPYRELAYDQCDRTPVCSLLKKTSWIYQSSFSKTLAPGLRLGYLTCSPTLFPLLTQLKQAADLHSNRVAQHMVLTMLNATDRETRLSRIVDTYREKRDVFHDALNRHFTGIAQWNTPAGGLFFWLKLLSDQPVDTRKLLPEALDRRVAFMPGEPFYPDERESSNEIRLNFSHADPHQIDQGLSVLAELFSAA